MITLALFNYMAENNIAGLVADENFFYDEMPMTVKGEPASGTWIVTRSGEQSTSSRGFNMHSTADFYIATGNKAKTDAIHMQILKWVTQTMYLCKLDGSVGGVDYSFSNIRMRVTSTPENMGITENGNVVKMVSVALTYDIKI